MIDQSAGLEHRLKVLEQTLQIIQKETNEVLGQVQITLQGFSKGTRMALETLAAQAEELDARLQALENPAHTSSRQDDGGKEL